MCRKVSKKYLIEIRGAGAMQHNMHGPTHARCISVRETTLRRNNIAKNHHQPRDTLLKVHNAQLLP
jgi:hypothetical protein